MNFNSPVQLQRGYFSEEELYRLICNLLINKLDAFPFPVFSTNDWKNLELISHLEGVSPLIYHLLVLSGLFDKVPGNTFEYLRRDYYNNIADNDIYFNEKNRLAQKFWVSNIPVLFIKGAALAQELYVDSFLRPMTDLDLFVHPEDLDLASRVILSEGYTQQKMTYHIIFLGGPGNRVTLELHWNLLTGQNEVGENGTDWLWKNVQIANNAYSLSPESNLIYLSSHLILQHGEAFARLIWYYDLHLLLTKYASSLNWDWVIKQARKLGLESVLFQALHGTSERFGTTFPHELFEPCYQKQTSNDISHKNYVKRWIWASLRSLPWSGRVKWIFGVIFPQKEYMLWKYGERYRHLFLFLYPLRWWELLKGQIPFLLRGDEKKGIL